MQSLWLMWEEQKNKELKQIKHHLDFIWRYDVSHGGWSRVQEDQKERHQIQLFIIGIAFSISIRRVTTASRDSSDNDLCMEYHPRKIHSATVKCNHYMQRMNRFLIWNCSDLRSSWIPINCVAVMSWRWEYLLHSLKHQEYQNVNSCQLSS